MSVHVITVKMYRCAPGRKGSRGQRWRWRATAANNRIMATSGEAYTNELDCITAIEAVFGPNTRVFRERPDKPEAILRDVL